MQILDADRPAAFRLFRRFDSEPFQKTLDSVRNQRSIVQIHFGMYRKYVYSVYPVGKNVMQLNFSDLICSIIKIYL